VGGIPEVVADGLTGRLVHYDSAEPEAFETGLARAVNAVVGDRSLAGALGSAGRARAIAEFDWSRIATQTVALYDRLRKG
jgi:starch synthase